MKPLIVLVVMLSMAALALAQAETPEDQYVRIYGLIQEADILHEKNDPSQAVLKYLEAQGALKNLQIANPNWNEKIVKFRLQYIADKLDPLLQKNPALASAFTLTAPAGGTNQTKPLYDEISRLTAQNALLDAKLREALSVQPAAVDPIELARAQEKIRQIEKERDLLRVAFEREKAKSRAELDPGIIEDERRLVGELKKKLAEQTEATQRAQQESQGLQRQIAELKLNQRAGQSYPSVPADKEAIAALEASNKVLRTDLLLMESRLSELVHEVAAKTPGAGKETQKQLSTAQTEVKELTRERDDLQKQLAASLSQGKRSNASARPSDELKKQLETARARIDVLEAKSVPYSAEELALFKQPPLKVALTASTPSAAPISNPATPPAPAGAGTPPRKKGKDLPMGAGPLMTEAQRAIDNGQFDEAEKKYLDVLRQDENNTYVLANLAAVQLDQNRTDAAEKTLQRALGNEPEDPAALYLMGSLKFRQEKFDEALDALSLSAKLNPDKAQTQYFLGQVLIQKGNRSAAEAALRKAIQLKPGWGDAHYLLAVMYSTQKPPFKELAEWHYKRAIAGGAPRNAEFEQWMERQATARR